MPLFHPKPSQLSHEIYSAWVKSSNIFPSTVIITNKTLHLRKKRIKINGERPRLWDQIFCSYECPASIIQPTLAGRAGFSTLLILAYHCLDGARFSLELHLLLFLCFLPDHTQGQKAPQTASHTAEAVPPHCLLLNRAFHILWVCQPSQRNYFFKERKKKRNDSWTWPLGLEISVSLSEKAAQNSRETAVYISARNC